MLVNLVIHMLYLNALYRMKPYKQVKILDLKIKSELVFNIGCFFLFIIAVLGEEDRPKVNAIDRWVGWLAVFCFLGSVILEILIITKDGKKKKDDKKGSKKAPKKTSSRVSAEITRQDLINND